MGITCVMPLFVLMNNADLLGVPGSVGAFIDDLPLITHANIRPYVIAILLHRGAIKFVELLTALTPHCPKIDLQVGTLDLIENCSVEDKTRLELLCEEVLGEMVCEGLLRYNEEMDMWVLALGPLQTNLTTIINWVSSTGGQLPQHILLEIQEENIRNKKNV